MRENKYFIPLNYRDGGTALNGMTTKRNIAEGIVLGIIGLIIVRLLPITGDLKFTCYVLVGGIGFAAGCIGVNGDPLFAFVSDALKWTKRRKPYIYNNHGEAFSTSSAELALEQPQFRDTLADLLDKIRLNMAAKRPDLVEGETFQFAVDPELQALKIADAKKQAKEGAFPLSCQTELDQEQTPLPKAPAATSATTDLDIDSMINNMVLHDEGGANG